MSWAPTEVQKAIFTLLSTNVPLSAAVTGVYDHVPQAQAFPFVVIGSNDFLGRDSQTTNGYNVALQISVWSRGFGRKGAHDVMQLIDALLHNTSPTITGWNVLNFRRELFQINVDPDSVTYQGIMRYNLLLGQQS
jgi:hypothetical protein